MRSGRLKWAGVVIAWGLIALVGCKGGESTGDGAEEGVEDDASSSGSSSSDAAEDEGREAFGLPFPPKVANVVRRDSGVKVSTRMELDQLERFFETRLQDFEILRPAPNKIRVVGLYEYMPEIRGHQFGPVSVLYYRDRREEPEEPKDETAASSDSDGSGESDESERRGRTREYQPGTPVQLETDEGEPLAPGAKWGEPYTPPPGTPLHKPRYRENFGKPIGEWQLP